MSKALDFEERFERAMTAARKAEEKSVLPSFKKRYLRFGELPRGRSRIDDSYRLSVQARTGVLLPEYEKGVSVFPAYRSEILNKWVLPDLAGMQASAGELWSAAEHKEIPVLLVEGKKVGEGSDGEPLLARKSVKVIKRLVTDEIWSEGEGIYLDPNIVENRHEIFNDLKRRLIVEKKKRLR
jgi:hypothetical protein